LRPDVETLHIPGMKLRKPKKLVEMSDKPLRVRYSEVVALRELVKKAQSEAKDRKSNYKRYGFQTNPTRKPQA